MTENEAVFCNAGTKYEEVVRLVPKRAFVENTCVTGKWVHFKGVS